jgi:site-specific recombinase XerD
LAVLLSSGLRVAEVADISDDDIDFREGVVWVLGKGRKERDVNLNPETKELIRQWIAVRDANPVTLKPAQEGRTFELQRTGIQELMRKISREVGFNVHPHMCRHTFALSYLKAGMDVAQLRRMMGHKSIETTLIYANLNAADVRPVHDTIKPPGLLPDVPEMLPAQPSRRLKLVKRAS